jgi:predicted deacylase
MSALTIGPLSVDAGEKKSGELVLARRAYSQVRSPLTVIRGIKQGPTLTVIAGEHGCEYVGITAAVRLCRDLQPERLAGTIIVIPVVNTPSFETRSFYVNPLDGVNIWTKYPGDAEGSITYAMAKTIFDQIILKTNFVIQMHGGDGNEAVIPYAYFSVTGKREVDEVSEALARSFPVDYIFPMGKEHQDPSDGGPKGTSYSTSVEGTIYHEASIRGIPGALCEVGRDGKIENDLVEKHFKGVLNAMCYLGMMEGKPSTHRARTLREPQVLISAHEGGLFQAFVEPGQMVKQGQVLGEILNLHGEVLEDIKSPINGILLCRANYGTVDPNPLPSYPYLFYMSQIE